jgi:prepilin-type N-terminal cleavage/methylation domain-containing protein
LKGKERISINSSVSKSFILKKQRGFTLIEIIAVLMILSIMASFVSYRFIDLETSARNRVIDSAISELNGRESLVWASTKVSPAGWMGDNAVFAAMNTYLGPDYTWTVGPTESGGTIEFETEIVLTRAASSTSAAGNWSR